MDADLQDLAFEAGGSLLVKRAVRLTVDGGLIHVTGTAPDLAIHLRAWCRSEGHAFLPLDNGVVRFTKGPSFTQRWAGSDRAGGANPVEGVVDHPPQRWGLAARGALVESGSPEFAFQLADRHEVWSADAARIYAQAAANQWDPATAVPWNSEFVLPDEIEDAVVQIMTYLVENEAAALIVPSRFLAQLHPHFREVMQVLAVQAADEARHVEVFTRRTLLRRDQLGLRRPVANPH